MVLGPGADCSLGPANGTGVRPGPVPSSPSLGFTTGTQLPLSPSMEVNKFAEVSSQKVELHGRGSNCYESERASTTLLSVLPIFSQLDKYENKITSDYLFMN